MTKKTRNSQAAPGEVSSANAGGFARTSKNDAPDAVGRSLAAAKYDFLAGQELPVMDVGATIDIDGTPHYLTRDSYQEEHWVDGQGDELPWPLNAYDFNLVEQPSEETAIRPAATLLPGDVINSRVDGQPGHQVASVYSVTRDSNGDERRLKIVLRGEHAQSSFVVSPDAQYNATRGQADNADQYGEYFTRVNAASSAHTDAEAIARILVDEEDSIHFTDAVMRNPNITAELIEIASRNTDLTIRRRAVFHPLTSVATLHRIRRQAGAAKVAEAETAAAVGFAIPARHHSKLADENAALSTAATQQIAKREAVAQGKDRALLEPTDLPLLLVEDRVHMAENDTRPEFLTVLAIDLDEDVRRAVALNGDTPGNLLKLLRWDPSKSVADATRY